MQWNSNSDSDLTNNWGKAIFTTEISKLNVQKENCKNMLNICIRSPPRYGKQKGEWYNKRRKW